jgi:hypothetical protein
MDSDFAVVQHFIKKRKLQRDINAFLALAADYQLEQSVKWGGSVFGHKVVDRQREMFHQILMNDYFVENPVFDDAKFRRRFRMSRPLFLRILEDLKATDVFFTQRPDATGKMGFSSHQRIGAAIQQLGYGFAADVVDQYFRLSESAANETLIKFCQAIRKVYGDEYLRKPTKEDTERLLVVAEERGFPGMLGSVDCMHWVWKNCPMSKQGQYTGRSGEATLILEAVASYDLWIWHCFFGLPGSLNDINVLHRSHLFSYQDGVDLLAVNYTVNGKDYDTGYYLADGIYPEYSTLVKTVSKGSNQKHTVNEEASLHNYV